MTAVLMMAVLAAIGMVGCGDDQQGDVGGGSQYAEDFDQSAWAEILRSAYEAAPNDFLRAILADGQITVAEMREANYRLAECLTEAGFPAWPEEDYTGRLMVRSPYVPGAEADPWWLTPERMECTTRWWGPDEYSLGFLWNMMLTDPGKVGESARVSACLVRHGQAPEDFTAALWDEITGIALLNEYWAAVPEEVSDAEMLDLVRNQPLPTFPPYLPGWGIVGEDEAILTGCQIDPHL
ncbi:MAG: hypothetical protein FWD83_04880 [Promicromonosporaceae bacterium]|nr:hypothetical protein [Promicromonosporaceae bacterium]